MTITNGSNSDSSYLLIFLKHVFATLEGEMFVISMNSNYLKAG